MRNIPFEFAVLRYLHDPVTQEFLNIGVVLYSKEERYLKALINKRYGRVSKTFNIIKRNEYLRMITSVNRSLDRLSIGLQKEKLFDDYPNEIEGLLKRVLPPDDSSLRFGGFGGGMVNDLDKELDRLYYRLVEIYEDRKRTESRRDDQVWHDYAKLFSDFQIVERLESKTIETQNYEYHFQRAFKNDRWHPVEPISLDLADASYIREKAAKWIGRAALLADSDELGTLFLLLGAPSRPELQEAYEAAAFNLETKIKQPVKVVREEESEKFSEEFANYILSHST